MGFSSRRIALLLMASIVTPLLLPAQEASLKQWSYRYQNHTISLQPDARRAALLLEHDIEDPLAAVKALLTNEKDLLPVQESDQQEYANLWFLRFEEGTPLARRFDAIARLDGN